MSGQRAAAEPYATRFETEVIAIDGRSVWLDRTHFYAESGGQPSDRGTIGDHEIADVQLVDGEHVHVLTEDPTFRPGRNVLCSIDWSYRMYCMRAHTASHVLYGAGRRLLEDLGYGGFDIGDEKVRVDFETSTTVDDETLVALDSLLNRTVWESRPVSWQSIPLEDARKREGIAFNEATETAAFDDDTVRIVTIGAEDDREANGSNDPWDVAACGGTHVRNTREIGPVTVLGRSNPGEGLTRVEFAVGPRAIDRREQEKRAVLAGKQILDVGVDDVPETLHRLSEENETLATELESAKADLLEHQLEHVEPIERNDQQWLVTTVDATSTDRLRQVLEDRLSEDVADLVVLAGEDETTFAAVCSFCDRSAAGVVDDLTTNFGGGGGGSDRFAQAGGFDVSARDLIRSLE